MKEEEGRGEEGRGGEARRGEERKGGDRRREGRGGVRGERRQKEMASGHLAQC